MRKLMVALALMPLVGAPVLAQGLDEAAARERLAAAGFTELQGLRQDPHGVWRATGWRNSQPEDLAVDADGRVVAGPEAAVAGGTPAMPAGTQPNVHGSPHGTGRR